ncbi:MAG: SPFH domain-containing protein [Candidatus Eisenbacteria bacterium]
MALWDFIKGELLEIIEWTDAERDVISWHFLDEDKAINAAPSSSSANRRSRSSSTSAVRGRSDPASTRLTTDNIPILTRLQSWKFGSSRRSRADVYFVNTRLFTGNRGAPRTRS